VYVIWTIVDYVRLSCNKIKVEFIYLFIILALQRDTNTEIMDLWGTTVTTMNIISNNEYVLSVTKEIGLWFGKWQVKEWWKCTIGRRHEPGLLVFPLDDGYIWFRNGIGKEVSINKTAQNQITENDIWMRATGVADLKEVTDVKLRYLGEILKNGLYISKVNFEA